MATVVLDANILLRLILPSQRDPAAAALWQLCATTDTNLVIPSQGVSEAMSAIRNSVYSGVITEEDGERFFAELRSLAHLMQVEITQFGAGEAAKHFNRPRTYDCEFYALAEQIGADFWTADDRFVNAMGSRRPDWVKRLSEFQTTTGS